MLFKSRLHFHCLVVIAGFSWLVGWLLVCLCLDSSVCVHIAQLRRNCISKSASCTMWCSSQKHACICMQNGGNDTVFEVDRGVERKKEWERRCAHCKCCYCCCCNWTRESKRVSIHHYVLYELRPRSSKDIIIHWNNESDRIFDVIVLICISYYMYALCIHTFDALTHTNFRSHSSPLICCTCTHARLQHLCTCWNDAISFSTTIWVFWHMDAVWANVCACTTLHT